MNSVKLANYLDRRLGKHQGSLPELQWHCPFCLDRLGSESSKPKLRFNVASGKSNCFRCGFRAANFLFFFKAINGGRILSEERGLIVNEIYAVEPEKLTDTVLKQFYAEEDKVKLIPYPMPRESIPLWGKQRVQCRRAYEYLESRNVPAEDIEHFKLRYCLHGDYAMRIIFPVFQHGRLVYWTNRFAGEHHPIKTKNPPNKLGYYSRKECLLNFDNVVGCERVTLVEGPFDVMGAENGLGLMGKFLSATHLQLIDFLVVNGLQELVNGIDPDAEAYPIQSALMRRVPAVSYLALGHGDPASRRAERDELIAGRRELTFMDRVQQKLGVSK